MPEKIVTKADLTHFIAQQNENLQKKMREIRRENGWQSAEDFLTELEALKFDSSKMYPWEK
jgi:hypothetical protein